MNKSDLLTKLDTTTHDLLEILGSYSQEQFNKVPFEGSWTGGQVAEHLFKAEGGLAEVMTGKTEQTERDPEQHVKTLDDIFLNFSTKLKSPDFILPGNGPHSQSEYFENFRNNRIKLRALIEQLDLSETCLAFRMPTIGHLTRYELMRFVVAHSTRHIRQFKNIHKHLVG